MKPADAATRARKRDYIVTDCPFEDGAALITAFHYARGCANTAVFMHGLYRDGCLVGVAHWLPPTKVCAQSVAGDGWRGVLSLSRAVVLDSEPKNAESILIGASIRLVRHDRRWTHLVTFADKSQGHTGAIYRATNWRYVGETRPEARWVDGSGRQVSRKSAAHSRTRAEMEALGYRLAGRFGKHKFTLDLRRKAA